MADDDATADDRDDKPTTEEPEAEKEVKAKPAKRRVAIAWLAVAALGVIALDLITKTIAVATFEEHPKRLLGGAVYLVLARNSGAAFGLAAGYTYILAAVASLVVVAIIWYARRLGSAPWGLALGFVLGGAVGNLIDRIFREPAPFRGHVVDFISLFDDAGRIWPVFNVADSALFVGVGLVLFCELTGRRISGARVRHSERDGK